MDCQPLNSEPVFLPVGNENSALKTSIILGAFCKEWALEKAGILKNDVAEY